jgi:hypothetical protein
MWYPLARALGVSECHFGLVGCSTWDQILAVLCVANLLVEVRCVLFFREFVLYIIILYYNFK